MKKKTLKPAGSIKPAAKPKKVLKPKTLKKAEAPAPVKALKKPETPKVVIAEPGPIPVVPKKFKWVGKKDPRNKKNGYVLVSFDNVPDSFPKPHKAMIPNTFYRVDPKTNKVECMVTVMPDGVYVAWSGCNACGNSVLRCTCKAGYIHPRSVEWIYIRGLMRADGIKSPATENIDSTGHDVTSRGLHWYKGKGLDRVPAPKGVRRSELGLGATRPHPTPAKPADRRTKTLKRTGAAAGTPTKTMKRASTPAKGQVSVKNLDITKVNADAAKSADALTAEVEAALSNKPVKKTKTLRKR